MRYADALPVFRQYLEARGLAAEDLDAQAAVTAMLNFYADEHYCGPVNRGSSNIVGQNTPYQG